MELRYKVRASVIFVSLFGLVPTLMLMRFFKFEAFENRMENEDQLEQALKPKYECLVFGKP